MSDNIIQVKDLVREFPSGEGRLTVLNGIDLEVNQGEILSIVGPSGAGKSTLLHIMGLLDRPTNGAVYLRGQDLARFNSTEQAQIRNNSFGFVFQFYHLIPEMDVLENTLLPYMIRHSLVGWLAKRRTLYQKGRELLNRLGLEARVHHRVSHLSGGEKQRVAIARALITEPEIVFCDEPTGNLDRVTSQEIQGLIWELNRERGLTFIIVTHEESIAQKAHRFLRLVDGQIQDV